MGWSGAATVKVHVWRKRLDGKLVPASEEDETAEEIEVTVRGHAYFEEGRTSGPADDCYPSEGATEIEAATHEGKPIDLTEDEEKDACAAIEASVQRDGDEDDTRYDD